MALQRPSDNRPSNGAVRDFLRSHHGQEPKDLESLHGGFWSAAFGYRIGKDRLVLRINDEPDGFRSDERAMRYGSSAMPVPKVLAVGPGFGRWFAVSRRHDGRFLEDASPDEVEVIAPTVVGLLASLAEVEDDPADVEGRPNWQEWLLAGITDLPGQPTSGWRLRLAADRVAERIYLAAEERIRSLLEACPSRGQLVHSDLLHHNVLITPTGDAVSAVFSWKCSTWGDSIYDLAWLTFWGRWHDGIGALDLWDRVAATIPSSEATDLSIRHHAYELQIGASHLGWYTALGDSDNLRWTVRQIDELLESGSRS